MKMNISESLCSELFFVLCMTYILTFNNDHKFISNDRNNHYSNVDDSNNNMNLILRL